jgi:hypothetical protein
LAGKIKSKDSYSRKIVLAELNHKTSGRAEFKPAESAYCELTEATANATYIMTFNRQEYDNPFVLVSSDGLEINKRFEFKKLVGRPRPWKLKSLGNRLRRTLLVEKTLR